MAANNTDHGLLVTYTDRFEEFKAFDRLPKLLREALREAGVDITAIEVEQHYRHFHQPEWTASLIRQRSREELDAWKREMQSIRVRLKLR